MIDWPIRRIDTHTEDAVGRLTYQYSEAERLNALIELQAERMQVIEDAAYSVMTQRWVPQASGIQLDEMGAIVGEPRLGRTDAQYRPAILLKIEINRSGGQPEILIQFIRVAFNAELIVYNELWPAKVEIYFRAGIGAENELVEYDFETHGGELVELDESSILQVVAPDDEFVLAQFARIRELLPA